MATEVLLMADVKGVGAEGDVVNVADGYARNFIIPKKLGAPVTAAARGRLEKIRREREEQSKQQLAEARGRAERLKGASCTITVKTGEDSKLYGSVSATDIADALTSQGLDVDRHSVVLETPIKELGVFDVVIRLHAEVEGTVKVWVVEE